MTKRVEGSPIDSTLKGLKSKIECLDKTIGGLGKVAVAFSGGVDSTLVLAVATRVLGGEVVAITAVSALNPASETKRAKELAASLGVRQIVKELDVLSDSVVRANPLDRCYHCKKAILGEFRAILELEGIEHLLDGSNAEDKGDYRPGARAVKEAGVISPLVQCGFNKREVRQASKHYGLPTWDMPAMACLATRLPYGVALTGERLLMVEKAEEGLKRLGFSNFRVRYHGEVARIELSPDDFEKIFGKVRLEAIATVKAAGFNHATVDLEGYRMGSFNETINWKP